MSEESAKSVLEIALFGGCLVRCRPDRTVELSGPKDRALLGFLAISPGVPHARDRLASLLWGESGDRQARDSLKQAVLRLRRSFAAVSLAPVVADRQTVALDRNAVAVDAGEFERLLREGTPEAVEAALALYRGDLLEGVQVRDSAFEDWVLVERQRFRRLATEAATSLMTQALPAGRRDQAAAAAQRLLSFDPLHEAACRTLMRIHADRAERAQALRLFETLRERLAQELSVAPEPETVNLYRAIRRQRAVEAPAAALATAANGSADREPAPHLASSTRGESLRRRPEEPSIAVLPFANIGGDSEQEYFADGLTEDIITDLSQISALFVVARHTVFAFKRRKVSVQQAADELNVRYILEGSVRKIADRVRITTHLIDGETRHHLWADRYDRSLDDIFALQDEISKRIVEILKVRLLPGELESIAAHSTMNAQAYQYYLMGRSFYLRGIERHSLRIAREMFAKAIDIDPQYGRAHAGMAICNSYLSMSDPNATFESMLASGSRALELDPKLPEGHAAKGLALYAAGRYAEAAAAFEQAKRLGPELFEAYFFYARNCRLQGLHQQALALAQRAAELRPDDFRSVGLMAAECKSLGRRNEFLSAARRCAERVAKEVEAHPDNGDALAYGSAILAELGRKEQAEDWARRAPMIAPDDYLVHYNVARTCTVLGKLGDAMDRLDRAFGSSPVFQRRLAAWMKRDEDLDPLRAHPRFAALLKRLDPLEARP